MKVWKRRLTAVLGAMAMIATSVAVGVAGVGTAQADTLEWTGRDTYLSYRFDGSPMRIGVLNKDSQGRKYYCIEAGAPANHDINNIVAFPDSVKARRLSWLMGRYSDSDQRTQAAIGVLAHDYLDHNLGVWGQHKDIIMGQYPDLAGRVNELWDEAGRNTPGGADIGQSYLQGIRKGSVNVAIEDDSGLPIAGVTFHVRLNGPAVFDNGSDEVSGVSASQPVTLGWKATDKGDVTASVTYDRKTLDMIYSGQDYARIGNDVRTDAGSIEFKVRKDFKPDILSSVAAKVVNDGQPVSDDLTSTLIGDDNYWVPDMKLTASGWYFAGLRPDELRGEVTAAQGSNASDTFLNCLAASGHEPTAYGQAEFTGPGQTVRATATTTAGGSQQYRAPAGGFGTWVWAFERDKQSEEAKEYLKGDSVSSFLEPNETNSNRFRIEVQSSVTEHSASIGSELSDTITVSGFPEDHGSFQGNQNYGFRPDQPLAQVDVWWAGSADGQQDDAQYRPQGKAAPAPDANHRLVGTWDFPAKNGTIRVGGGVLDAHGAPVNIVAQDHGWYVFVWRFGGDDRVKPAASDYDDAWERTRVEGFSPQELPMITTHVDKSAVNVGDTFHDVARVTGDLPVGSYVEFTAYEPVSKGAPAGSGRKIMDARRVSVPSRHSGSEVSSPDVQVDKPGEVYWQAAVVSPQGDVLTAHEVGVREETVTVSDGPGPQSESLAHTGATVLVFAGIGLGALAVGAIMVFAIRRRSGC
ncbi:peptidase [Bifidobacterium sp. ESL0790]|uniref:peptidase n=1 Tax=Bifidobacterium sp. ESL0790 TaxID=2983233 RepID=UPI0023F85CEB|nr:peptidase [Bifidobacterium sp. ESL0790]WEV72283.1 peptidase [Bifidobacterium sp. ESL0790]